MLSSSVIKNVSHASHYFSQEDNYYTRDEGIEKSEWWGKGALKLGLTGKVDGKQFTDLLEGKLQNGEQIGKMVDGEIKHRAGWDLTFSVPKSVSIMALVFGDKRLLEAHREAVNTTLIYIEHDFAQARIKTTGETTYQRTRNLVAALHHHDLSRAKDPQVHTHCAIMNMTERADGKWRSLASQIGSYAEGVKKEVNGFIERVRHHNRYLSKIYETELAYRVKELGYEITKDTETGIFEIAGISKEAIDFFSKRRLQIKAELEEKGLSGGNAASFAALATRDTKENVDRIKLKEQWVHEAKELGLDYQKIIDKSQLRVKDLTIDEQTTNNLNNEAMTAIKLAAKSLSVFQTTVTLEDLVTQASDYAIRHSINCDALLSAVDAQIVSGDLISLANDKGKTVLMAKSTLDDEKRLNTQLKDNKSLEPTVSTLHLGHYLAQHEEIDAAHHDNLRTIFGNDRIVLLEGDAARNALIEPIIKISKSANLEVAILSPSLVGSKQLAKKISQPPQTFLEHVKALFVDSTLKHYSVMQFVSQLGNDSHSSSKTPDLLIVDNANLLSTHQKANLAEWNKTHQTKLILLGNKDTLLSQQQGVSLAHLTEHGVKTVTVKSKGSDNNMVIGHVNAMLDKVADKIIEVKTDEDRHHAMANHYTNLNDADRSKSWLVVQNKRSADLLNIDAHHQLAEKGKLQKITSFQVLIPVFLEEGKGAIASSYRKDQMVRFNETYASLKVEKGEYLRVLQHSKSSNRVVLQKANGQQIIWQPDKVAGMTAGKVELFDEKMKEYGIGESIVFHRSIKSKKIAKGERFIIEDMRQKKLKLKNSDGKSVVIDLANPYHRHLDYGYAATAHRIAHEKPSCIIADLPAKSFQTDQRLFYQTISQPKEVWIYTDDYKNLAIHLEQKTGNRLTAHETLSKAEGIKKNLNSFYDVLEKQIIEQKGNSNKYATVRASIDAVDYAMKHLAEREAGFTHKQLMQTAMTYALGDVTQETLTKVTMAMEKTGILLRGNRSDGTLWTTVDAVKMEKEILALTLKDKDKLQPIVSDEVLSKYCDPAILRPEQIAAIKSITQSPDRVLSVQGHAGTGKTTMMTSIADVLSAKELLTEKGYVLQGVAPTHKAVKELRSRGITAQTIDSFLLDMRRVQANSLQPDFSKTVLVVDEASMVSNRKMLDVLNVAHDFNFREVIPTGDTEQNPSIEAGKPHELIQRTLDTTIYLKDIQRQKNPILIKAVEAIYEGDVTQTFSILGDSIIEIGENNNQKNTNKNSKNNNHQNRELAYQKRVQAIVTDYLSLQAQGDNVQIIAPSHHDRRAVNEEVRIQLNKINILKGEEYSFSVLSSKDMTGVERSRATNFKLGQILRFTVSASKMIKSGDYFSIKSIDKNHNILTLNKLDGSDKDVIWQVPRSQNRINNTVEVFTKEDRYLKEGDKIVWTRTNKKEGTLSTDFADVTHIDKGQITVQRPDNSQFTFNAKDEKYQHWDHAYAITTYGSQGGTYSSVLAIFESYRKNLMNLKNALVTITRAVNTLRIYTDDKEKLKENILKNTGGKVSSLEVIGEYPTTKNEKNQDKKISRSSESELKDKLFDKETPVKSYRDTVLIFDRYTIERIKESLNRDAEKIAIDTLGTPKMRSSHFLKFGSNQGSLSVTIKGEKQGWWNDFSDDGGRSMLSFIQKYAGLSKQEALEYGAKWAGIWPDGNSKKMAIKAKVMDEKSQKLKDETLRKEQEKRAEFPRKLAEQSLPIKGTLVEKYLKEHRAIVMENYPKDIRFHPGIYSKLNGKTMPAMLVIARDELGKIQAVQATYLDQATAKKADKDTVIIQKQTFGLLKGATATIHGDKSNPTLITEGAETGLSVANTLKLNVEITLGKKNFKNINIKKLSERVVFCLDNDGKNIKEDKLIAESAKRIVEGDKAVSFMLPTDLKDQKQDYNDILRNLGGDPIKRDFQNAVSYSEVYEIVQPSTQRNAHLSQKNPSNLAIDSRSVMDKSVNNSILISQDTNKISNEMVKDFSNKMTKDTYQSDKNNLEIYRSMTERLPRTEVPKSIPMNKDIEREI